jgi:hypothetical protein
MIAKVLSFLNSWVINGLVASKEAWFLDRNQASGSSGLKLIADPMHRNQPAWIGGLFFHLLA